MRPLDLITRDPLLKLTALVLAFLLWALVEIGSRTTPPRPRPGSGVPDSAGVPGQPDTASRSFPVAVRLSGQPPAGLELAGAPVAEPDAVTLSGPVLALEPIDSVRLPAIPLDSLTATRTIEVLIDTAGLGLDAIPRVVRVTIPIRPIPSDSGGGGTAPRPGQAPAPAGALP